MSVSEKAKPCLQSYRSRCEITGVRRSNCTCGTKGCGGSRCKTTGVVRSRCNCGAKKCGGSRCETTGFEKPTCRCGAEGCGRKRCKATGLVRPTCACGSKGCGEGRCKITNVWRPDCGCGAQGCGAKILKAGFTLENIKEMNQIKSCEFPRCHIQAVIRRLCSDHCHGPDGQEAISPENYRGEVCRGCNLRLADLDEHPEWATKEELEFMNRRPFSRTRMI